MFADVNKEFTRKNIYFYVILLFYNNWQFRKFDQHFNELGNIVPSISFHFKARHLILFFLKV